MCRKWLLAWFSMIQFVIRHMEFRICNVNKAETCVIPYEDLYGVAPYKSAMNIQHPKSLISNFLSLQPNAFHIHVSEMSLIPMHISQPFCPVDSVTCKLSHNFCGQTWFEIFIPYSKAWFTCNLSVCSGFTWWRLHNGIFWTAVASWRYWWIGKTQDWMWSCWREPKLMLTIN